MSQMGMQLPGAQRKRAPSINVYTGLAMCAVASLAAAVVLVYLAAVKVGPDAGPLGALKLHPQGQTLKLAAPSR